jgi:hypothetical protein
MSKKNYFGTIDVYVRINSRHEYAYTLRSEYEIDEFMNKLYHTPGAALAYLKMHAVECTKVF